MFFLITLIPASMIAAVGYIVLVASKRSEGTLQTVGKVLGIWLFVLALLPLAGGAYMAASGHCPMRGGYMSGGHMGEHRMMHGRNSGDMSGKMPGDMSGDMHGNMTSPKAAE